MKSILCNLFCLLAISSLAQTKIYVDTQIDFGLSTKDAVKYLQEDTVKKWTDYFLTGLNQVFEKRKIEVVMSEQEADQVLKITEVNFRENTYRKCVSRDAEMRCLYYGDLYYIEVNLLASLYSEGTEIENYHVRGKDSETQSDGRMSEGLRELRDDDFCDMMILVGKNLGKKCSRDIKR